MHSIRALIDKLMFRAVSKAYSAMLAVNDLAGTLPGTSSVATLTENVGEYESNVVQTKIKLGVVGDLAIKEYAELCVRIKDVRDTL